MIRFIDLRGQIFLDDTTPHFAFFDTIPDQFVVIAGAQAWHSIQDLQEDMDLEGRDTPKWLISGLDRIFGLRYKSWQARFLRLIPADYFKGGPDDISDG